MSKNTSERMLGEIQRLFGARREQFGRKPFGGWPLSFKRRATLAVTRGIAPGQVAKAAGVSEPSIRNWCKELKIKIGAPTELKLIDEIPKPSGAREVAVIHFQSGLRVEIAASALTSDLIRTLSGGAP